MELIDVIKDILITIGVSTFLIAFGTALVVLILKYYTQIDFENSLTDNESKNSNDIPNEISVKIISTVFICVFFIVGISTIGIFAII